MKFKDLERTIFNKVNIGSYFWLVGSDKRQKSKFIKISDTHANKKTDNKVFEYWFESYCQVYVVKQ